MRFNAKNGRFHKGNASRLGKLGVAARAKKRMENPPDQEPRRKSNWTKRTNKTSITTHPDKI